MKNPFLNDDDRRMAIDDSYERMEEMKEHDWGDIESRWSSENSPEFGLVDDAKSAFKSVAKAGMTVASKSLTVAQHAGAAANAVHVGGALGAAATGIGVATGGIGFVAAGAAFSLISFVKDTASWVKTNEHINDLNDVLRLRNLCKCWALQGGSDERFRHFHTYIRDTILPWIIRQKKQKAFKKGASAVTLGTGGILTTGVGVARNLYKRAKGTLGTKRSYYADVLAVHFLTHSCELVERILWSLFSDDDLVAKMRYSSSQVIGPIIAKKLKST
jgi:hypothetical protein